MPGAQPARGGTHAGSARHGAILAERIAAGGNEPLQLRPPWQQAPAMSMQSAADQAVPGEDLGAAVGSDRNSRERATG